MNYRILLVDDEPIILSGIKFLIDWQAQNCEIIGTARNGQQALESIQTFSPDIVISDIRMPVKSGLELLEECSQFSSPPVFIMLTNYQDFDLARQTMRLQAIDYLVKTQLEPETLTASLERAKAECDKRGKLAQATVAAEYMESQQTTQLRSAARDILSHPNDLQLRRVLAKHHTFQNFCIIQILMDPSSLPSLSSFSCKERQQLMDWESELVEKLAGNLFPNYLVALPDYEFQRLSLICWNLEQTPDLSLFCSKLTSASANTTQMQISLLCSSLFADENSLSEACSEITDLYQYHYLMGGQLLTSRFLLGEQAVLRPLEIHPLVNRLTLELRARNRSQAIAILQKISTLVAETPHLWNEGIECCSELYSVCSMVFHSASPELGGFFSDNSSVLSALRCCTTRQHILNWLEMLIRHTEAQLDAIASSRSNPTERAKLYVQTHVDEKITLQDAADAAGLSPSYLSALFKKEYDQNFTDFVNETKMQRACQLIQEGNQRIYEISYMLGFENAYYFTRVFRKHIGMTPTEYQRNLWQSPKE